MLPDLVAEGRNQNYPLSAGAISATDDVSGGAGTGTLIKWSAHKYSTIVTKGN